MPPRQDEKERIILRDCRLIFKNFKGAAGPFNSSGRRNFAVVLEDPKMVRDLQESGWHVKFLKPREEGDSEVPYLPVKINFNNRPPRVVVVTSRGGTDIDESQIDMLDFVEMTKVDMILRPYNWDVSGNTGKSAYLKTMFVTIEEDELEEEYGGLEDSSNVRKLEEDD